VLGSGSERAWLIRRAEASDLEAIVEVHMSSFPGFFLAFLGPKFLKVFYQEVQAHRHGILQVAETGLKIVGFVAGVTQQADFYRYLVKERKWAFAFAAMGAAARRPMIVPRLIRALGKPHESITSAAACLMSIAVAPASASTGIGAALVRSFSEELRRRSIKRFCLTTDRDGNDKVNNFYQKCGFKLTQVFCTYEGRWMNEYVMEVE